MTQCQWWGGFAHCCTLHTGSATTLCTACAKILSSWRFRKSGCHFKSADLKRRVFWTGYPWLLCGYKPGLVDISWITTIRKRACDGCPCCMVERHFGSADALAVTTALRPWKSSTNFEHLRLNQVESICKPYRLRAPAYGHVDASQRSHQLVGSQQTCDTRFVASKLHPLFQSYKFIFDFCHFESNDIMTYVCIFMCHCLE